MGCKIYNKTPSRISMLKAKQLLVISVGTAVKSGQGTEEGMRKEHLLKCFFRLCLYSFRVLLNCCYRMQRETSIVT